MSKPGKENIPPAADQDFNTLKNNILKRLGLESIVSEEMSAEELVSSSTAHTEITPSVPKEHPTPVTTPIERANTDNRQLCEEFLRLKGWETQGLSRSCIRYGEILTVLQEYGTDGKPIEGKSFPVGIYLDERGPRYSHLINISVVALTPDAPQLPPENLRVYPGGRISILEHRGQEEHSPRPGQMGWWNNVLDILRHDVHATSGTPSLA